MLGHPEAHQQSPKRQTQVDDIHGDMVGWGNLAKPELVINQARTKVDEVNQKGNPEDQGY